MSFIRNTVVPHFGGLALIAAAVFGAPALMPLASAATGVSMAEAGKTIVEGNPDALIDLGRQVASRVIDGVSVYYNGDEGAVELDRDKLAKAQPQSSFLLPAMVVDITAYAVGQDKAQRACTVGRGMKVLADNGAPMLADDWAAFDQTFDPGQWGSLRQGYFLGYC